jgi:hypothetical protein
VARLAALVTLAVAVAACNLMPSSTAGPTPSGGAIGAQLCDAQNPASLRAAVTQLQALKDTDDPAPLLVTLAATLAIMQQLELDSTSDLASWRDASIDAVEQIQERISDPSRRAALVQHAILTLGLFADRLCGPST